MAGVENVSYVREGRVARVTLDNPPDNELDGPTIEGLTAALVRAEEDAVSVLVLDSGDPRMFSPGVPAASLSIENAAATLKLFHGLFRRLYRAPYVTVAQVRGQCLGRGCELALFCDIVVAADTARFGLPEIDMGSFPPLAISAFPYRFGRAAVELVLTGVAVSATEALRAGLISRWVPRDELTERVDRLAAELAAKSAPVLALTVRTARSVWSPGFERALAEAERAYLQELVRIGDYEEGVAAQVEQRAARYRHWDTDEVPGGNG